jgi:hypothetical protein
VAAAKSLSSCQKSRNCLPLKMKYFYAVGAREAAGRHYIIITGWNIRSCGVLHADGMTVAEGACWHKELAIGCEHRLTRIAADTNLLRGCNQPTNTHPAPEPSPLLQLP